MHNTFDHGYALLVGVGESADSRYSLPVTVKDAQALERLLTDPAACAYPPDGSHVRLLHDQGATRAAIIDGLRWLAERAQADPDATVVIYYSGHGQLDANTTEYYLLQHDIDPHDIPASALAAQTFTEALRRIPARRLLVVLDCCHAEGMAAAKDLPADYVPAAPSTGLVEALKQGEGRVVCSSSRGRQSSYVRRDERMSIYTFHLLEALQGVGNRPGETEVHISNLMNHVNKAVPASARQEYQAEQTPFFELAAEDFPVALVGGGKGLPAGGWPAAQREASERIERIAQMVNVQATGKRSVAIGGSVTNSPIITGSGNIVGNQNTIQRASGHHIAQAAGGGNATVNDHSSRTTFDQRGQQVGTQYNTAGDTYVGAAQQSENLVAELQRAQDAITRAKADGTLDRRAATDAAYQVAQAIDQAEDPHPNIHLILGHLEQARRIVAPAAGSGSAATAVAGALSRAAQLADTLP
jgi:hypothetical protein